MDNYRSHLKLDFDPFEPGSNSRDFFTGGKRGDLLEQLIELSLHSKSLAVVTGSLGSGKSTLAKQICLSFREDAECVLVGATLFMNKPQFLEAIVEQLSLNPFEPSLSLQDSSDPGQAASLREEIIIENICQLAAQLDLEARAVILIVDDAHELGSDVIGTIEKMWGNANRSNLHIMLFGENQLNNMLRTGFSNSCLNSLKSYQLEQMGGEESIDYIRFKLATAGFLRELPLAGGVIGQICNAANGNPGALNAMTSDALSGAVAGEPSLVASNWSEEQAFDDSASAEISRAGSYIPATAYWALAATLVLTLFATVLFWGGDVPGERAVVSLDIPLNIAPAGGLRSGSQIGGSQIEIPHAIEVEPIPAEPEPGPGPEAVAETQGLPSAEPQKLTHGDDAVFTVASEEAQHTDAIVVIAEAEATVATDFYVQLDSRSALERELMRYPANNFTVQLLGSHSEANVLEFIATKPAIEKINYYQTTLNGKPWYVVVLGSFEKRSVALAAIQSLPDSLQALKPWVRLIASIQHDISQRDPARLYSVK